MSTTTANIAGIAPTILTKGDPYYCTKCGEMIDKKKGEVCSCGTDKDAKKLKKIGNVIFMVMESSSIREYLLEAAKVVKLSPSKVNFKTKAWFTPDGTIYNVRSTHDAALSSVAKDAGYPDIRRHEDAMDAGFVRMFGGGAIEPDVLYLEYKSAGSDLMIRGIFSKMKDNYEYVFAEVGGSMKPIEFEDFVKFGSRVRRTALV